MIQRLLRVAMVLAILSAACNLPGAPTTTPTGSSALITEVSGTLLALQTATLLPATPAAGFNTRTPTMTIPPSPTSAVRPDTPTVTVQPCDQAQFIADVTVPDGTKMIPRQTFKKTWRLRNLGSCTWDANYALVFSGGDALGAPAVVQLVGQVPSGATVDLSIDMVAPAAPGEYTSYWKLRNPAGVVFGVFAGQPFFAKITVIQATQTLTPTVTRTPTPTRITPVSTVVYDFTSSLCSAEWRSQSGGVALPCPGTPGDANGYIMKLESPALETGSIENNLVLLTVPRSDGEKAITGRYPAITIQSGYHFYATLGCLNGMPACSVIYQLNVAVEGQLKNLGEWSQVYDGSLHEIHIDLSSLAGRTVEIILVVLAGDNANQDQAVWVYPRITRQ